MSILYRVSKKVTFFLTGLIILIFLGSCGIWDPADARKVPSNSKERVKKNLEEGKGFSLKGMVSGQGGTGYTFARGKKSSISKVALHIGLELANA